MRQLKIMEHISLVEGSRRIKSQDGPDLVLSGSYKFAGPLKTA